MFLRILLHTYRLYVDRTSAMHRRCCAVRLPLTKWKSFYVGGRLPTVYSFSFNLILLVLTLTICMCKYLAVIVDTLNAEQTLLYVTYDANTVATSMNEATRCECGGNVDGSFVEFSFGKLKCYRCFINRILSTFVIVIMVILSSNSPWNMFVCVCFFPVCSCIRCVSLRVMIPSSTWFSFERVYGSFFVVFFSPVFFLSFVVEKVVEWATANWCVTGQM